MPPPLSCSSRSRRGFTLLEMAITLAIVSLGAALALPSFTRAVAHQRASTAMFLISTQLASARSTAVTRRMPVSLCPSRGDASCSLEPDWSLGWLMYMDPARHGQPTRPADILRDQRVSSSGKLRILSSSGRRAIRFQADGKSGGSNITLSVCSDGKLFGKVIVNNLGRARSERAGANITCDG